MTLGPPTTRRGDAYLPASSRQKSESNSAGPLKCVSGCVEYLEMVAVNKSAGMVGLGKERRFAALCTAAACLLVGAIFLLGSEDRAWQELEIRHESGLSIGVISEGWHRGTQIDLSLCSPCKFPPLSERFIWMEQIGGSQLCVIVGDPHSQTPEGRAVALLDAEDSIELVRTALGDSLIAGENAVLTVSQSPARIADTPFRASPRGGFSAFAGAERAQHRFTEHAADCGARFVMELSTRTSNLQ